MYVIGITGGIGTGKSTAAAFLKRCGLPVIDADACSHRVTAAGGAALPEVEEAFGEGVLGPDGGLDRGKMAQRVFSNRTELDRLSRIVHLRVLEAIGEELAACRQAGAAAAVLDVPLPVREGFLDRCHHVIAVTADRETRLVRLGLRGMARPEALHRMAMQLDAETYAKVADFVLDNNGTEEELYTALVDHLRPLLGARGIRLVLPEPLLPKPVPVPQHPPEPLSQAPTDEKEAAPCAD